MTKSSGLGAYLYWQGVDLSNDIQAVNSIACPQEVYDKTGIDKSAYERIGGRRDGMIGFDAHFNPVRAHPELAALSTSERILTYCTSLTAGKPSASLVGFQMNYDGTRDSGGDLTFASEAKGSGYGLDWGQTFGLITHTSGTSTTALDVGAAIGTTAFGFQAFLHVVALTGTNVVVTMEGSSDNGVGDAFASLGAFASKTAVGAERIAATGNVERYVRFTTSGTFSSATVVVQFTRNLTAVSF